MRRTMEAMVAMLVITVLFKENVVECRRSFQNINPNCECGISGEGVSNRIVGGAISIPHIFPWVVAIFNRGSLHCGGTVINDRYIMTAGHCVKWTNANDLTIGLGMHDIENNREGFVMSIEQVILHEKFESDYLHDTNDVALIKLEHPVEFNDNVRPVCLPYKGSDYSGHKVKVAGWGKVSTTGGASRFLRQTNLEVMSYSLCRNTSFGDHLTESMLCAYTDDTDACQGDSGGPLLYKRYDGKYEIIGVVSWGIGCAKRGMPGVYVKTTDYLNWLHAHTSDAVYCLND